MSEKRRILVQLDTDAQPSVFDGVVAVDAGVDFLFRHGGVTPANVRELVHGAIFTRGPADLKSTALFVGGSNVSAGEALLAEIRRTFFGPMRVSVMMDSNGANTTAAAAVLAAAKHVPLAGATALVLAATGPVGQRVARLLSREGATVRVGSRTLDRANEVCLAVRGKFPAANLVPVATASPGDLANALADAHVVIAAGAPGVELLSSAERLSATSLRVAIDLNAVPPLGLAGVDVSDRARERDGVTCYGAIGVGATKMKIHRRALDRLFASNDQILDAEEILELGRDL